LTPKLELERPRELGELVTVSFNTFTRHFTPLFTLATIVVTPYVILIEGLWGRALAEGSNARQHSGPTFVYVLVGFLVVQPLMAATVTRFLLALTGGRQLDVGQALREGVSVLLPAAAAVALAAVGIGIGALFFLLPGIWLAVRWAFVAQAVVVEDARGAEALRASQSLVDGKWWSTCGRLLVLNLVGGAIALVTGLPAAGIHNGVVYVVLTVVGTAASVAYTALATSMLYFDRRARTSSR
jgi:hypothetical protein